MQSLNSLKSIVLKLKKREIRYLENFIELNQKTKNEKLAKSIQLLRLITSKTNNSSAELQFAIYGKVNYSAFNKLISRLKEKIYEVLLMDQNIEKTISSKRNRIIFNIRKRQIQSDIMFSRGITFELESFQKKIINTAKQFEIYDSLIEALQARQRYAGFRSGIKANNTIKKEIDFYENSRKAYNRSLEIYNSITSKINFSSSTSYYKEELDNAIITLKADYEKTQSASIGYYYFLLLTEHFQNRNDFVNARKTLINLKQLLIENISIYTKNRLGNVLINLANNEFLVYNFNLCLSYAKEALEYFQESTINVGIIKEVEFNALFYLNRFDEAEKLILELLNDKHSNNSSFQFSKRSYMLACLKLMTGRLNESHLLISNIKEIEKDKEGWNIGKRILIIILLIEKQEFELAELQVQSLQKHIRRTLKTKDIRKREVIIIRILIKLINEHFDFRNVFKSRKRYFELLESKQDALSWKIKSPELIIFHEWFKSKVEKKPYSHSLNIIFNQ